MKFKNKKVLIILILVFGALLYVFNTASSNMDNKSEQLEKKVKELKVNKKDSEYILKSDATKYNIPYKKRSEITIDGKKYCAYHNKYEYYAIILFDFSLLSIIEMIVFGGKYIMILVQETKELKETNIEEKEK